MSKLKRYKLSRYTIGVALLLVALTSWWISRALPAVSSTAVEPVGVDLTADSPMKAAPAVKAITPDPRAAGASAQLIAPVPNTGDDQVGTLFDLKANESQLLAMQFADAGDTLSNWRRGDPNDVAACLLVECGILARAENAQFDAVRLSRVLGPNTGYGVASCRSWIDRFGSAKFAELIARPLLDECTAHVQSTGSLSSEVEDRIWNEAITDAELIDWISGDTQSVTGGRFWLQRAAIGRALRDKRVLWGLKWTELEYRLDETTVGRLSLLMTAKLYCETRGACGPHSLLLNLICLRAHVLDCQVNADLSQIARDSLTPREYRWWQDATVPAGKKKG